MHGLVILLVVLAGLHIGAAYIELSTDYLGSMEGGTDDDLLDRSDIGDALPDDPETEISDFAGIFGAITSVGDAIVALLSFKYGFLVALQDHGGLVGTVGDLVRLALTLLSVAFLATLGGIFLTSGLLSSGWGIAVAASVGGLGGVSVILSLAKGFLF